MARITILVILIPDCNQITVHALEFKVWFDDETDVTQSSRHWSLSHAQWL